MSEWPRTYNRVKRPTSRVLKASPSARPRQRLGFEPRRCPYGIPFILDTLPLDALLKGDVNHDGPVNNLDITPFVAALASEDEAGLLLAFSEASYAAADVDMSG